MNAATNLIKIDIFLVSFSKQLVCGSTFEVLAVARGARSRYNHSRSEWQHSTAVAWCRRPFWCGLWTYGFMRGIRTATISKFQITTQRLLLQLARLWFRRIVSNVLKKAARQRLIFLNNRNDGVEMEWLEAGTWQPWAGTRWPWNMERDVALKFPKKSLGWRV